MQWIILIGNEYLNLNQISEIKHDGENKTTSLYTDRFVVDYGDDHVFYENAEDIINDYEEEDLKKIPFSNPRFIMMTYTNEKLMKQILCQENFLRGIYVDDDNGNILPIEEFVLL
ncbi:hypothetical protein [Paenibacillus wynnii]|uniref:Uncharacterized protein n=1 Tax=Paenibacillus wynnii TaxID=268407 RepID=A0A098MC04_9BACL|nr:hypothetical protein [Paenibacillus wynnii]KGE19583.1 hypothetical protein PWYN_09725 [Paenibacillus wynnii]